MQKINLFHSTFSRSAIGRTALLAAVVLGLATGALAKDSGLNYLTAGKPAAATLLAPPPLIDSPEQAADLQEVKVVYHSANSNDRAAAYSEKKFTVFNFSEAVGDYFNEATLPQTAAFFEKVQSDAAAVTDQGKDYFKRPRPYSTDPSLANGKLEKSFSYPSGHSTESMVLALVLADLIPERHDAIIAHARIMGWHRVQIARHYPTDILCRTHTRPGHRQTIEEKRHVPKRFQRGQGRNCRRRQKVIRHRVLLIPSSV